LYALGPKARTHYTAKPRWLHISGQSLFNLSPRRSAYLPSITLVPEIDVRDRAQKETFLVREVIDNIAS
jgi:hypothetical protein